MAVQPISDFLPTYPAVSTSTPKAPADQSDTAQTSTVTTDKLDTASTITNGATLTTASTATTANTQTQQPSREQIDQAMKEVKQALPLPARNLQFSIDQDTGKTVVKVVDPSTKEVIRQIPSEEILAIAKALDDKAVDKSTGLLVKQKV